MSRGLLVLSALACALALGCGGGSKKGAQKPGGVMGATGDDDLRVPRVDPSLCETKGKKVQTFDLNRDNKPDVWKLYATVDEGGTTLEVLTCKQVDYDHDGKKDYVATYKRTGEMIAEEFDFTFDGNFDAREHYDAKTGKVFLIERDSDHDKKPDIWEKYDDSGALESVRRDRNGDGKPDVWEQYAGGELVAILYDDDYDNRVDRKEERKTEKATPEDAPPAAGSGGDESGAEPPADEAPADEAPADEAPADEAPADGSNN